MAVSLGLAALSGAGCIEERRQVDTEVGGHRLIVQPACEVSSLKTVETHLGLRYELKCGGRLIQIDREHLIIDGRDFGNLRPGDVIRIVGSDVAIDGEPRTGSALFEEAL